MSREPVDPARVEGKAECSGDPSVAPFSVEMVVSTLLPSCFSKDLGHTTLGILTQLPLAPAWTALWPEGEAGVCVPTST